jgi:transcriptional regulator with XRE-family HTH domain
MIQKQIAAIVAERNSLGALSQRDLAKALGCSQATVSYLLKGQRGLSEKWIERFCRILNISLADLEKPTPPVTEPRPLLEIYLKVKLLYEKEIAAFEYLNGIADLYLDLERRAISTTKYDKLLEAALELSKDNLPPLAEI